MTKKETTNIAASVRQRLLDRARAEKRVFQELATFYAMERFLFRLAASPHADRFVLKGGVMTLTWAGEYGRPTRDVDLLGWGDSTTSAVVARLGDILATEVPADGVVFDLDSLEAEPIAVASAYVGVRARFTADFGGMVVRVQVDVGFGDAVVPEPTWVDYPQLLDLGAPRVLGYPAAATLAEKLHAVCSLGLTNSRMKDYYDLWTARRLGVVTAEHLGAAIRHTFARRGTPIPAELPVGLTTAFVTEPTKQAQWKGFVRKSRLEGPGLGEAVEAAAALGAAGFAAARD
ncbi:MAG: nucleotidyl transferase AbiEii/AbiGii toxin family protein [Alphaproteobacteria bacterium]|nr:nucleotidyl transferase AbiEii/AbiGii toxin family protein [Alphaproteobacteria bacterium]